MAPGCRLIAAAALLLILSSAVSAQRRQARSLPPAACRGRDFAAVVEAECGRVARGWILVSDGDDGDDDDGLQRVFVERWLRGSWRAAASREDCERAVTARELQKNIVVASDMQCVAQILVQTGSIGGIEDGFRIAPNFNFQPTCGARGADPDVVAMKGIALAILAGGQGNKGLVAKIVDGLVPSLTPPEKGDDSQLPSCANHPPPCAPCNLPQGHLPTHVNGSKMDHKVDRSAVLETLSDGALMLKVFNEDPNLSRPCVAPRRPVNKIKSEGDGDDDDDDGDDDGENGDDGDEGGRRRRLLEKLLVKRDTRGLTSVMHDAAFGGRRLQCADCDNADSFPCAYCWQEDVCDDMYWCQDQY